MKGIRLLVQTREQSAEEDHTGGEDIRTSVAQAEGGCDHELEMKKRAAKLNEAQQLSNEVSVAATAMRNSRGGGGAPQNNFNQQQAVMNAQV